MDDHDKKIVIDVLIKRVNPFVVYLFGSEAKKRTRKDSDIDIAYLSDKRLSEYERFMVGQEIAGKVNREVDLIDLDRASTVFQVQVIGRGERIYQSNQLKRMEFEMKALKMYSKLNEERKPVLDKIEESGTIYER